MGMTAAEENSTHDLVLISSPTALESTDPAPDWVEQALLPAAWVVVRRAIAPDGMLAVGVRGDSRSHRWPAFIPMAAVRQRVSPQAVPHPAGLESRPAFDALRRVARHAETFWPGAWGPGGSVAFELVAGRASVHDSSDLDVILRAPQPLWRDAVRSQLAELRDDAWGVRLDVMIETALGGVVADEWLAAGSVVLRTPHGPRVVDDPWIAG